MNDIQQHKGWCVCEWRTATLADCAVDSNGGSGLRVDGRPNQAIVTRCSLSHNAEWGVYARDGGKCSVSDSHMTGNGKDGIQQDKGGKVTSNNTIAATHEN